MTNKKIATAVDMSTFDIFDHLTVNDAIAQGLVFEKSDLPKTDGSLSRRVEYLVKETTMSYSDIVSTIKKEFPHANTSTKSVASVACVMRKSGTFVPYRLKMNQY